MGGAFTFKGEALPVWAHNAAPVRAPKTHTACPGCYYLFHIGSGHYTSPPQQCGPGGKELRLGGGDSAAASAREFVPHSSTIGPHSQQEKHAAFSCTSAALCPTEAAAACAAQHNCSSFGIGTAWNGGAKAQLYSTHWNESYHDAGWTLYSCSTDAAPTHPSGPPPPGPCVGLCGNTSSLVHRSRSGPGGPWAPLASIPHASCNNPAPAFAKNGTLFVLCSSSSVWRTDDPTDAEGWELVSKIDLNDSPWTGGTPSPYLRVEDPCASSPALVVQH